MAKKATIQVKVRITKDLQRRIQREADRRGQTINAEIIARLEESFELKQLLGRTFKTVSEITEVMEQIRKRVVGPPRSKGEFSDVVAWLLDSDPAWIEPLSKVIEERKLTLAAREASEKTAKVLRRTERHKVEEGKGND